MKNRFKFLVLVITCWFMTAGLFAQVGIGTNTPNSSAILELQSTDKGFLPPRMTSAERDAIMSPANGLIIFNTTSGCPNYYSSGNWYEWYGNVVGSIASLGCSSATITGTLTSGVAASGVSGLVPYTGGNGGTHQGQTVSSTGVTGLTAATPSGSFANGAGSLTYTITGTPASSGTASFALNIGGQSCNLDVSVLPESSFTCGTSTVTFNYNGSSVTYGTVVSVGSKCWLDRNMGATQVANSSTDAASYGHLFQWGRLDDGHQVRTSPTTMILSNNDVPGHGNFIRTPNPPYDWRSPQNNNLWQGAEGTNNPCPDGYRPPTNAEWDAERANWSTYNAAGAYNSPLKLTVAGFRHNYDLSIYDEGLGGFYWSSAVNDTFVWGLGFNNSGATLGYFLRALGFSVRCIKD